MLWLIQVKSPVRITGPRRKVAKLVEMKVNNDLKLNCDSLAIFLAGTAFPSLEYLLRLVVQSVSQASRDAGYVDISVLLNNRIQNDGSLNVCLTGIVRIVGFGSY